MSKKDQIYEESLESNSLAGNKIRKEKKNDLESSATNRTRSPTDVEI